MRFHPNTDLSPLYPLLLIEYYTRILPREQSRQTGAIPPTYLRYDTGCSIPDPDTETKLYTNINTLFYKPKKC